MVILILFAGFLGRSFLNEGQQPTTARKEAAGTQEKAVVLPQIPPPTYRLFKSGTGQQTTYVVPVNTSDEQLKSLLWFFRTKVRTGDFRAIGITQPTTKQWGQYGYTDGMLVVYRGTKCANEAYISTLGPCGYGEHDDAYYQWGLDNDPYKDAGAIATENGDFAQVFDYRDNWHAASEGLRDAGQGVKEAWKSKHEEWEPKQQFAVAMTNKLNEQGIDIDVSANEMNPEELDFRSKLFKDRTFQESFVTKVLPNIHPNLCSAGFRSVRVLQGTDSDNGRTYPLQCQ